MDQAHKDQRLKKIKNLYINTFGREADPAGLNYWYHSQLSIAEIEAQFRETEEYQLVLKNKRRAEDIRNLYCRILDREADVDGLRYWVQGELSISEIEAVFKQSDEYKQIAERKRRLEEIKSLYRCLLSRAADEFGLHYWYHTKLSVNEIKLLFKESHEYKLRELVAFQRSRNPNKITGRSFSVCTIQPIDKIVEEAFQVHAKHWKGSLNIYMPGKTGEILFLLGYFPSLRRMIPRAKIIFHTLTFYISLVKNVLDGPDQIEPIEPMCTTLADSVYAAILSNPIAGFEIRGSDLWVSPFRAHERYSSDQSTNPGPFYRAFADAIGAIPNQFERPKWMPLLQEPRKRQRIALALPTSNKNASIRQILPFSPSQWEDLAEVLKDRGLTPLATGHKDDPSSPPMPGWTWTNPNLIDTVTMVLDAEYLISYSTGLAFAAASFGKAQIVMIDELNEKYTSLRYGLEPLSDVIDTSRLWAIFSPPDGSSDRQAYKLAFEVASKSNSSKGYTTGYPIP